MTDASSVRETFAAARPFVFDDFQVAALDAIDAQDSVVVAAPTGSGKTLVAEYAVAIALAGARKAFYTTPLKALSNQKYHDFVKSYGPENVGLLTGDNSINGEAPIVVMTTEVLRNMIYVDSPSLKGLEFVVLDEVHYLQNAYRGPVWEEVIIHLPPEVRLVCLSATVSNAGELAEWIQTVRGSTVAVIEERRPVALTQFYAVAERSSGLNVLPVFNAAGRANTRAAIYDKIGIRRPWVRTTRKSATQTPGRVEMVDYLEHQRMLPAIFFVFSRNGCDDAVKQCLNAGLRLTTAEDRERIRAIVDAKLESLSDADLAVLDFPSWLSGLEAGVAAHHAGLVPPFKEVVEACFSEALVKVVFATETLALGINMPARTVVIEKLTKFTGERHEFLTPGEYTQLTGRAGRRGIDELGHVVVLWSPFVSFEQVANLAATRNYLLTSSFRPTYNMAVNLVHRYPPDVARHLLNLSFAQFRADVDVVRLERQLDRADERIAEAEARAKCDRGDVRAWRRKHADARERQPDSYEHVARAIDHLHVGDVIEDPDPRDARYVVVISTSQRRGHDLRLGVLTPAGRRFSLVPRDFALAPHRVHHIELPRPYVPSNRDFVRRAASALEEFDHNGSAPQRVPSDQTGVGACPEIAAHLGALDEVQKLTRDRERLEESVKARAESLARQFDRVLSLLRQLEYVDGWELTDAGEQLRRVYHESDLFIVECLRQGVFDDLDPAEIAAVASVFSYEGRGSSTATDLKVVFPTKQVRKKIALVTAIWNQLSVFEQSNGLTGTRAPDAAFCGFAWEWVKGEELAEMLEDEDISAGDFVRNIKQLIDLLRQLAIVLPHGPSSASAGRAAGELFRGVVAASSQIEAV